VYESQSFAVKIRSFEGHKQVVRTGIFSPDGHRILTGSDDWTARLWDSESGELLRTLEGIYSPVQGVAFAPGGRVVTASAVLALWDPRTEESAAAPIWKSEGYLGEIRAVAISPNGGQILTAGTDSIARFWDTEKGLLLRTFAGHTRAIHSVAFSEDGRYFVISGDDKTARLWDTATGQAIGSFKDDSPVLSVSISKDDQRLLTANAGGMSNRSGLAKLWNTETKQLIRSFDVRFQQVLSVDISPDRRQALTGEEYDPPKLWDASNGKLIRRLGVWTGKSITSVKFSADGRRILTGGDDSFARLWDSETGQLLLTLKGHQSRITSVAFAPDKEHIVTGSADTTAKLWDIMSGRLVRTFKGHTGSVNSVAFSHDGTQILTGSDDHSATLWSATTGGLIRSFNGHAGSISSVAVSPDGRFILSGSTDTTTRLWNAASGTELAMFICFENDGWAVVDPEGRFDTNNLDGGAPLAWVISSDPMRALPLEIFMRDYYTPGLLSTIVKGQQDKLPNTRPIDQIKNLVQPDVQIKRVTPSAGCGCSRGEPY